MTVAVGVAVGVAVDVGVAVGVAEGAATKVITPLCAATGMAIPRASAKVSTVTLKMVEAARVAVPVVCQVMDAIGSWTPPVTLMPSVEITLKRTVSAVPSPF